MGGCATKPKVLREASNETPAPPPSASLEAHINEPAAALPESKDVVEVRDGVTELKVGGAGDDLQGSNKGKEIVDDDKADDLGNKRRSLSHLFKEYEEKEMIERDKAASLPVEQELLETGNPTAPMEAVLKKESSEAEKPAVVSVTKLPEAEKSQNQVQKVPSTPEFVDALEKIDTVAEAPPTSETQTKETSEKKETETEKVEATK